MNALLIIDVQRRFGWSKTEFEWGETEVLADPVRELVVANIVSELREARLSSRPIIFIVYGDMSNNNHANKYQLAGGCAACDENIGMVNFLEHRHCEEGFEPLFFKTHDDAFSNPNLSTYLKALGIREVTLVGCNTYACVKQTACGALKAGFNVTLLGNCTYTPIDTQDTGDRWIAEVTSEKTLQGNQVVRVANIPAQQKVEHIARPKNIFARVFKRQK